MSPFCATSSASRANCVSSSPGGAGARSGGGTVERTGTGVRTADVVVVVTDVNSHGAAWRARRLARLRGSVCYVMSRCGPTKFVELLTTLTGTNAVGVPSEPPRAAARA